MSQKPAPAGRARPSQNAPASQSASTNVWRLLEGSPGFNEGMTQAQEQADRGEFTPYKHKKPRR